jgi:hypothetical protein
MIASAFGRAAPFELQVLTGAKFVPVPSSLDPVYCERHNTVIDFLIDYENVKAA